MKRAAVLMLSLAGALIAFPAFSSAEALEAARKLPVCGPSKATSLRSGETTRVYAVEGEEPGVFACLAGGRTRRLDVVPGLSWGFVRVDPRWVVLRGHWVAYFRWTVEVDVGDMSVGTTNLRTGRTWSCDLGRWNGGIGLTMRGLVATGTGTAGWVGERVDWPGGNSPLLEFDEVATCRRGEFQRLDTGEGIELESLQLAGRVMSWINSGVLRSVRLP